MNWNSQLPIKDMLNRSKLGLCIFQKLKLLPNPLVLSSSDRFVHSNANDSNGSESETQWERLLKPFDLEELRKSFNTITPFQLNKLLQLPLDVSTSIGVVSMGWVPEGSSSFLRCVPYSHRQSWRYKWGNGGWQSSCCTTNLSMYPLPALPNKRHARIGGRKMSGSAFNKLLSWLTIEGHDLSNPVDLKENWAKHGTNRYITIK
ncbi:hypothetical protein CASFOL_021323 [Castilleja foliolosa]|uniref:GAGA-binding transcriptional activator n=1 Tax=Castilleja foliolosa TaxID=1961234 RepID=A0ABD3CYR7_9LAMI